MAPPQVTGRKPRATAGQAKRKAGPPQLVDPGAIEVASLDEPKLTSPAKTPPIRGPPVAPACFTIKTFCLAHHLSEAMFFKMREMGIGPDEMRVGSRVLISFEAAARWRTVREAATATA
jgi:hypothetical protein